jgi:hypothetical protein
VNSKVVCHPHAWSLSVSYVSFASHLASHSLGLASAAWVIQGGFMVVTSLHGDWLSKCREQMLPG